MYLGKRTYAGVSSFVFRFLIFYIIVLMITFCLCRNHYSVILGEDLKQRRIRPF